MGLQRVIDVIGWEKVSDELWHAKVYLECGDYTLVMLAKDDLDALGSFVGMAEKIRQIFPQATCSVCPDSEHVGKPLTFEDWQQAMDIRFARVGG